MEVENLTEEKIVSEKPTVCIWCREKFNYTSDDLVTFSDHQYGRMHNVRCPKCNRLTPVRG